MLPIYHTYGHKHFDELGSAASKIQKLSYLPFFTLFDEDFYADTVTEISKPNELNHAVSFQVRLGLGQFFRTDQGQTFFVVERTNDPKRFEILRDKLDFPKIDKQC